MMNRTGAGVKAKVMGRECRILPFPKWVVSMSLHYGRQLVSELIGERHGGTALFQEELKGGMLLSGLFWGLTRLLVVDSTSTMHHWYFVEIGWI